MKNKILNIIVFVILVLIGVLNSYRYTVLYSLDEVWAYGFGHNISNGLIPYKDFNMVIGPIFPYFLSIVLNVFGKKLIIYHIVVALMVGVITYLASKKIKIYAILIYLAMLIYSSNGYNTSTLLLLFILLKILDKEENASMELALNNKFNDIVIPVIVSIMALTKQTLGILVIPSLIYSKNKKKSVATYLVIFLIFLSYLIFNNNLIEFLDYCIFGLFDFASSNTLIRPIYLFLEIIIIILLSFNLIKSKFRRKDIFYVLLYQVIVLPIVELNHFVLGYSAFIYILFQDKKIEDYIKKCLFISFTILEVYLIFITNTLFVIRDREYFEYYTKNTYLKGRLVSNVMDEYVEDVSYYINKYSDYKPYIFNNYSYFIKLDLNIPVNKFDLINTGNMGYNGEDRYIEEIKDICSKEKCLFIINESDLTNEEYSQVSKKILEYVVNNNIKVYSSEIFSVFIGGDL